MLLSDLAWADRVGQYVRKSKTINDNSVVVYEITNSLTGIVSYTIQPYPHRTDGCWFNLDPITAQAVLFHLTNGGNLTSLESDNNVTQGTIS